MVCFVLYFICLSIKHRILCQRALSVVIVVVLVRTCFIVPLARLVNVIVSMSRTDKYVHCQYSH